MLILEAHHLHKTYREKGQRVTAVQDVSLKVSAGEVLAFLGPNGAGKTTSIKMIAGLIRPDSGWVSIAGRDPHHTPTALRSLGAVLEGNRNIYWPLTAMENLEYFGAIRGLSRREARRRGAVLLERFRLSEKRDKLVKSFSRGMQQKLAIAVALIHQPQLLLLDEPTLGLDVEATEDVKVLVREIAAEGCAIVLTTHQLAIAEELSDRVAIIRQGEIVTEEPTAKLIQQFSEAVYVLETAHTIPNDRRSRLQTLGVEIRGDRTVAIPAHQSLYPVFEILNPMAIVQIEKDQANLTDIFLKLIRD